MNTRQNNQAQPRRRGFSLVEMIVVMAIVTLMAVVFFPMIARLRDSQRVNQTQLQLATLHAVATDYKLRTGQAVNRNGSTPIDWTKDKTFNNPDPAFRSPNPTKARVNDSIEKFVWACFQINDLRSSINALDLVDLDNNGFMEVRDAWDKKIEYADFIVHSGSSDFLPEYGNAVDTRPFFVSAGPDGDFGSYNDSASSAQEAAAEDNILSFDPEGVSGR